MTRSSNKGLAKVVELLKAAGGRYLCLVMELEMDLVH